MEKIFIVQLDEIISEYEVAKKQSQYSDASDILSDIDVRELETRCLAAIERASGHSSIYLDRANAVFTIKTNNMYGYLAEIVGVAKSLRHDLDKGYLKSFEELIHGALFADYLEMAEHLNNSGFKDAAAVIAGSTLETHLKQLCAKHNVSTLINARPKKADTMNADLAKIGVYSKLYQKSVTAWLGLRNDAAHGNYSNYSKEQVALLISNIRDFITKHPA